MEKLKFILFSVVILTLLGLAGYWSVVTLQSGTEYKTSQKIDQFTEENEELKKEIGELKSQLAVLESEIKRRSEELAQKETPIRPISATTFKNQNLIDELEKLVADNVFLKLKSRGGRVGTVQNFLNIYNKTSNRVDNDYGADTIKAVAAFQKDQGLSADGEAGPSTFSKMIEWLKQNF